MHRLATLAVVMVGVCLLCAGIVSAGERNAAAGQNETAVGMTMRNYVDDTRMNWQGTGPRPLTTHIWYPANKLSGTESMHYSTPGNPVFVTYPTAGNAALSEKSEKYPLILFSHGTGGAARQMLWLGRYLASRGYIVAALNHHGNTGAEAHYAAQGFLLYWERPKDLTAVLDKLLSDPIFGNRIDKNRIGAVGFSLGGYTVIAIAGGAFSEKTYDDFCASPKRDFTCEPQHEFPEARTKFEELKKTDPIVQEALRHDGDSYRDKRIRAVFAIAPALGSGFTETGLKEIKIPVYVVIGEADKIAPLKTNAQRYANIIEGAKLCVIPGNIGHYAFLAECTPYGKKTNLLCKENEGVDQVAAHEKVSRLALSFFDSVLTLPSSP